MDTLRQLRPGSVERTEESPTPPDHVLRRSFVRGAKGGLIATAVMTAYRAPVFRALPPTAEFWATYIGDEGAKAYPLKGLVLHFLYGAAAGSAFGPAFETLDRNVRFDRDVTALVTGLLYGLVLSVVGTRVIFRYVLETDLAEDEWLVFHVGHVVYGLTLGTWLGSQEQFGAVYD